MRVLIMMASSCLLFNSMPVLSDETETTVMTSRTCGAALISAKFTSIKSGTEKSRPTTSLILTIQHSRTIEISLETDWIYSLQCIQTDKNYVVLHKYMPGNISDSLFSVIDSAAGVTEVDFPKDERFGDSSAEIQAVTGIAVKNSKCTDVNNSKSATASRPICFADPELASIYKETNNIL